VVETSLLVFTPLGQTSLSDSIIKSDTNGEVRTLCHDSTESLAQTTNPVQRPISYRRLLGRFAASGDFAIGINFAGDPRYVQGNRI